MRKVILSAGIETTPYPTLSSSVSCIPRPLAPLADATALVLSPSRVVRRGRILSPQVLYLLQTTLPANSTANAAIQAFPVPLSTTVASVAEELESVL